jgi:transcriptional regulator with XRE-family HTH domain
MKQRLTALKAAAEAARKTDAYRAEGASIQFTEELVARLKASGLTRTALAEKIGASPAYVTKILRGDTNFTLDSMVKIANALGCDLLIRLQPTVSATKSTRHSSVTYRDSAPLTNLALNDETRQETI